MPGGLVGYIIREAIENRGALVVRNQVERQRQNGGGLRAVVVLGLIALVETAVECRLHLVGLACKRLGILGQAQDHGVARHETKVMEIVTGRQNGAGSLAGGILGMNQFR